MEKHSSAMDSAVFFNKRVSKLVVFCYGVGHFLNDMTAACWFNYLLVFLIEVSHYSPQSAGLVMLSGQIADAISTPLVGLLSDRTKSRFGRRKVWLAGGAVLVNLCFYFVFSPCYLCEVDALKQYGTTTAVIYFSVLAALFNVGWASVQVAHMSLVPEITTNENDRVVLNSARFAGGITATLSVLGIAWVAFKMWGVSFRAFHIIAICSIAVGDFFTMIFLVGVKEPTFEDRFHSSTSSGTPHHSNANQAPNSGNIRRRKKFLWKDWFKVPMFYQVGIVYMFTRLTVNMSQVFLPFYLEYYLNLVNKDPTVIATTPLIWMAVSFIASFLLKRLNASLGRQSTFLIGSIITVGGLVLMFFMPVKLWYLVFVAAVLLGAGTATITICAANFQADLIGTKFESGAFVYGAHSFFDKLANGLAIEFTSKYSKNSRDVRFIVAALPGGAMILALICTYTIVQYFKKWADETISKRKSHRTSPEETKPLVQQTE